MDVWTKEKRSAVMSLIRGKGNRDTEMLLVTLLRRARIKGWRRHVALPGKPDFTFRESRLAVFVDGCFWHGCPEHCRMPKSHKAFWTKKISANRQRDRKVSRTLRSAGWRVFRIWEHDLKDPEWCVRRLIRQLRPPASAPSRAGITPVAGS